MRRIRAEGLEIFYFARDEGATSSNEAGIELPPLNEFMRTYLPDVLDHVRMVAVPSPLNPRRIDVYYLHWRTPIDLVTLDSSVAKGVHRDEDFAPSILTIYQKTWCKSCGSKWHTLVAPPDTYIGLGDLRHRKISARKDDIRQCPSCRASLRQIVLEIFGASGEG